MKFVDTNGNFIVLNLVHITRIENLKNSYLVVSFDKEIEIAKDGNGNNLFEFMATKAAKDILGVQGLDTMQSKINDMLANLNLTKKD
jgi:hypothetical protein